MIIFGYYICLSSFILILDFCSLLYVESADRPGLLVDLVKTVTDIDVAVESGEFDTEVWSCLTFAASIFIFLFFSFSSIQVYCSSLLFLFGNEVHFLLLSWDLGVVGQGKVSR